jgi:nucleoside transporter
MKKNVTITLSIMMFLQFFSWGAWYGQMSKYMFKVLNAEGSQVGEAYSFFSIAMIIAPFFMGLIADRYFSAQKVLGILNILGALVLFFLVKQDTAASFNVYILAYCLTFAPTIALSSSIALKHLSDPSTQFPNVRVWGTIAWFVVSNIVGYKSWGDTANIFYLSIGASVALGVFSFFLPDTPPSSDKPKGIAEIIGLDSLNMFKDTSYLIFFIGSILVCIPLSFYYAMANPSLTASGMENVEGKMSLGLISEFLFMLAIPFFMKRFGIKWVLLIGLGGWILRFFLFGQTEGPQSLLLLAILLHGLCYDFFFVSGQIYTEQKAGPAIKAKAQALITLATYGIGMYIGSILAGKVTDKFTVIAADGTKLINWGQVWMVPMGIAAAVFVLVLVLFKDNTKTSQ